MLSVSSLFGFTLPDSASSISTKVDDLYNFIMLTSFVGLILLGAVIVYFALKYKRKSDSDKTPHISHNNTLEFIWTAIPAVVFVAIAIWGYIVYQEMVQMPKNALTVEVVGKQWSWAFTYNNKKGSFSTMNKMVVPVNKPVLLNMASTDVIHSFFVPAFRIKKDVVPGMKTQTWFTATKKGTFRVYCAEYCGTAHSAMVADITVVGQAEYDQWVTKQVKANKTEGLSLAQLGERVFKKQACMGCHSVDGSKLVGPTLKGIWMAKRTMSDGSTVTANEEYIRESILNPAAKIVKGHTNQMTPYQGVIKEKELTQLIAYLKSLSGKSGVPAEKAGDNQTNAPSAGSEANPDNGKALLAKHTCTACHSTTGQRLVGPTFKASWGTKRKLEKGGEVLFDIAYLTSSLNEPNKQIAKGYPAAMTSYKGKLSESEIRDIAAYLKSLK